MALLSRQQSGRVVLFGVALSLLPFSALSQQAGVDLMGSPIPGITAHGHHAIGVNPSLLASERPFQDRKAWQDMPDSLSRQQRRQWRKENRLRFFSGVEGGLVLRTPVLDGTPLVQWSGGNREWTLAERRDLAQQMGEAPTSADVQLRWAGWSRHGQRGGWAWSVEDRYSASASPSPVLASYVMLGPASSLYDQVQLSDGSIVDTEDLTQSQFEMAESGIRNGGDVLALELLDGSHFAVQHVRSYGAGFGIKWLDTKALTVATGFAARYYRGTGYYEVDSENRTAFAAFNKGFGAELVAPNATLGSALRPAGFGVAVDASVRVEVADLWFASLAVTEVGSMDWRGESYSLNNPVATLEDWVAQQGGALDLLNEGLSPSALFLEATPKRRVVDLPTRVRLDGGMRLGSRALIGIELAAPINDALLRQPTEVGVGGRTPLGPLLAMGGLRWRNTQGWTAPVGIIWCPKNGQSQFGLATDDAFGWLAPERRWGWGWSYTRTLIPARGLRKVN